MKAFAFAALTILATATAEPQRLRTETIYNTVSDNAREVEDESVMGYPRRSLQSMSMTSTTIAATTAAPGRTTVFVSTPAGGTTTAMTTTTAMAMTTTEAPGMCMSMSMSMSMSIPPTESPTRSPLPEGQTFPPTNSPTPAPTRSPLAEGETHSPSASPIASPTEPPTSEEELESGAIALGSSVAAALITATGAIMIA